MLNTIFPLLVAYQMCSFYQSFGSTYTSRTLIDFSFTFARQLFICTIDTRSLLRCHHRLVKYISQHLSRANIALCLFAYVVHLSCALVSLQQLSQVVSLYVIRLVLSTNPNPSVLLLTYQNSTSSLDIKNKNRIGNSGDPWGMLVWV